MGQQNVLSQIDLSKVESFASGVDENGNPIVDVINEVRSEIARGFWAYYNDHKNDIILDVKILIIPLAHYRLQDLHGVFVLLFGPEPAANNAVANAATA